MSLCFTRGVQLFGQSASLLGQVEAREELDALDEVRRCLGGLHDLVVERNGVAECYELQKGQVGTGSAVGGENGGRNLWRAELLGLSRLLRSAHRCLLG